MSDYELTARSVANSVPRHSLIGDTDTVARQDWRSAGLAQTMSQLESELRHAWAELLTGMQIAPGSPDEAALAWLVIDAPAEHDWRVVDAALDRLICTECRAVLTHGPADCDRCRYYNGMRFAAREVDRPNVPPGNEHAIRVAFAVAHTRDRYAPRVRAGYELALPALVAGDLLTTSQAQAAKALINKLTPDECDQVTTLADIERLAHSRRRIDRQH